MPVLRYYPGCLPEVLSSLHARIVPVTVAEFSADIYPHVTLALPCLPRASYGSNRQITSLRVSKPSSYVSECAIFSSTSN